MSVSPIAPPPTRSPWLCSRPDALIADIQFDVKVALNGLARPAYAEYATSRFLTGPPGPPAAGGGQAQAAQEQDGEAAAPA